MGIEVMVRKWGSLERECCGSTFMKRDLKRWTGFNRSDWKTHLGCTLLHWIDGRHRLVLKAPTLCARMCVNGPKVSFLFYVQISDYLC